MSHISNPRRRHPHAALHLRQATGNPLDPNQQSTSTDPNPIATFSFFNFPTPIPVEPSSTDQPSTTPSSSDPSLTSSSSSSTSTSTSTSTTPTSSSISSAIPATPTTTTTTTPLSSSTPASTFTFFQTVSNQPANGTSARPSSTSTSSPVGGASGGIIAGGIIAAILGTAGIVFALVYFLRKCRRNEDEALAEEIWNRPAVVRQSVIVPDEPDLVRPYNAMGRGSPRPPTMIERHLNNAPSMLSRQPQPNMYTNSGYGTGYGATQYSQPSFSPGDVVSPTSANPFISPYAQNVMTSPVSSVPDYHDPPSPASPALPPPALTRQPSSSMDQATVVRQNSVTNGPHSPVVSAPDASDPRYISLSRSSVTPFQAAQYADITEKLRTPMSSVMVPTLGVPRVDAPNVQTLTPQADLPPQEQKAPTESPFADPDTQQPDVDASQELDTEVPLPTPVLYDHMRISSTPPTLPEIHVPERSFSPVASLEFPVPLSARETPSPFSLEFSDLRTPPPAGLKHKSSPLASSSPTQVQPTVIPHEVKADAEPGNRDTVYTLYDEEDAYGGI